MSHPDGEFEVSEGFDMICSNSTSERRTVPTTLLNVAIELRLRRHGSWLYLDHLVCDAALLLNCTIARKELFDQAIAPDESYEELLWCLYTLRGDLQVENSFMNEDRATITSWIIRMKLYLIWYCACMAIHDRSVTGCTCWSESRGRLPLILFALFCARGPRPLQCRLT
ncbi:hypothetical protein BDR04DRAFT_1198267 [Suillus decipiens]|nr:hypothetical protein BDR04DRAFT_1198267 [Suillus decipiens]